MKKAAVAAIGVLAAHDDLAFANNSSEPLAEAHSASNFFPNFKRLSTRTSGATINCVVGGTGSGLLLLHGYPQTHIMWRKMAPQLSERYTVVVPDLRGYGDSSKPADGENHFGYSKRAMAQDMVELMRSLGFSKFAVAGHDRGGRVAHRMALDHADVVAKVAVLDIIPTYKLYHAVTKDVGTVYSIGSS
jgi:haloacetate dehalogenase